MDGTVQIFKAETGQLLKWFKFNNKVRYIEYSIGDKSVLLLEERFTYDEPSVISVYATETLLNAPNVTKEEKPIESSILKPEFQFDTRDKDKKKKLLTKASWYINNTLIFASTYDGCLLKYDKKGELVGMVQAHEPNVEIKSFSFSRDFSIVATAAVNGCRVYDPETLQLLKVFKQELPMNSVSISPLFCSETNPKYHLIIAGGIPARESAMTGGSAGFDIILCNVMYETELGSIPGHFSPINSVEFFPDGRGFISGS
jgi:translation initiation factor 3 subunit I